MESHIEYELFHVMLLSFNLMCEMISYFFMWKVVAQNYIPSNIWKFQWVHIRAKLIIFYLLKLSSSGEYIKR